MTDSIKQLSIFFLIIFIALIARVSDFSFWQDRHDDFFIDKEPLIHTVDGYYYLTLAKLWKQEKYHKKNFYRTAPNHPNLPKIIPLLSLSTAILSETLNISLNSAAIYLTIFMPLLTLIPMYFLAYFYGGKSTGFMASLFFSLSAAFAFRSSLGWYDTDILNLFFLLWVVTSCTGLVLDTQRNKAYYLLSLILATLLWMWWWNFLAEIVFVFSLLSLLVALIINYRPRLFNSELLAYLSLSALAIIGLLLFFPEIATKIWQHINYLLKFDEAGLASNGLEVAEQQSVNPRELVQLTFGGYLGLLVFGFGLLMFLKSTGKNALLLTGLLFFSLLSLFAQRYMMFLAPITAIMMAYAIVTLWKYRSKNRLLYLTPIVAIVIKFQLIEQKFDTHLTPLYVGPVVQGVKSLAEKTPKNSIVWSWWDQGYLIHYWGDRATISDGSTHSSQRNTYNALPLLSNDYRFAANFMVFYSENGMEKINQEYLDLFDERYQAYEFLIEILSAGPKQSEKLIREAEKNKLLPALGLAYWSRLFFPAQSRPIYLFIDQHTLSVTSDMFRYTAMVLKEQKDTANYEPFIPVYDIKKEHSSQLKAWNNIRIDLGQGILKLANKNIRLSQFHDTSAKINSPILPFARLRIQDSQGMSVMENNRPEKYTLDWNRETGMGLFSGRTLSESILSKLFIFSQSEGRYFVPIDNQSPLYQIWKIQGDRYSN